MTTDSPGQEVSTVPPSQDEDDDQDVLEVGKFIIVKYDEKRYVGQISDIQGEDIQVNCMVQHGQKNTFQWPDKDDSIYYSRTNIIGGISEPEPCGRVAKLAQLDWIMFNTQLCQT